MTQSKALVDAIVASYADGSTAVRSQLQAKIDAAKAEMTRNFAEDFRVVDRVRHVLLVDDDVQRNFEEMTDAERATLSHMIAFAIETAIAGLVDAD